MGRMVQRLVSAASFDASGTLVPEGHIGTFDEDKLTNDAGKEAPHLHEVGDFEPALVEVAPIAPTGPNPKIPQQIPPGAVQAPDGTYRIPGKVLVGEVTDPAGARIDDRRLRDVEHEDKVNETLEDIMGPESTGFAQPGTGEASAAMPATDGTVATITADLGTKTDAELTDILASERAKGAPRKGVINAVEAELDNRKKAQATS